MAQSAAVAGKARSKLAMRDIFEDPRIILMLALGFSSGLPLLLVLGTFSTRLAYSDVDIKAIGLFSYLALPYTLKFLWAPLIDRFDVPVLSARIGRRRSWMIATQVAVALSLSLMATANPASSLVLLGLGAFLVAICAATQDVVIDGWRIDAAGTDLQGVMAATSNLGYRLALMCAGAGALFIADWAGWSVAYFSMAALMGVGMIAALLAPAFDRRHDEDPEAKPARPDGAPAKVWSFRGAVLEPLTELHTRLGPSLWAILILVAFYRMPDFISGVMASPLYRQIGFTLTEIGAVSKLYGIWVGIAGAFVGGWAMTRLGLFPTLVIGAFLGAASNLSFSWLSYGGPEVWRLTAAISIDNFCGSFAGMALIAYMSSLTAPGFAATQYALFSSLYALPGKLVAGTSGLHRRQLRLSRLLRLHRGRGHSGGDPVLLRRTRRRAQRGPRRRRDRCLGRHREREREPFCGPHACFRRSARRAGTRNTDETLVVSNISLVDDTRSTPAETATGSNLSEADRAALVGAVRTLETPGLAARLSSVAGAPLDMISRSLPAPVTEAVSRATEGAMRTALRVALATLPEAEKTIVSASAAGATGSAVVDDLPTPAASTAGERFARFLPTGDFGHKAMAALSGAVGGAFGIATLPLELPVSTTLMLRSIAEIAREEGEDLSDPENALACVQVFALGGRSGAETALTESGYFAVRAALAKTMSEAARYAGNRALLDEAAPALIRFSTQIAARFGLVVSQKVAAQAVPILGAVGGAAVNTAFMNHFQAMARAHFTVRRLERTYGKDVVRVAYIAEKAQLAA